MKKVKRLICRILLCVLVTTQTMAASGIATVQAASPAKTLDKVIVTGGNFDTGITINQNYSFEMTFAVSDISQYKNYYFANNSNNTAVFSLRNEVNTGLYATYGWYREKVYSLKANEEITVTQKKNITYINGTQVQKATAQTVTPVTSLKFGDFKGYIKSFQIWNEAGTLVANLVPALDTNSKACMYDKVKGQYHYYTGTCTAGTVVESSDATTDTEEDSEIEEEISSEEIEVEIEEIEQNTSSSTANVDFVDKLGLTNGTFDTGIKMNQSYSVEVVFSLSTLSQYRNIYSSNVDTLRNESTNGLYGRHGWYNEKIYSPEANEEIVVAQKKNVIYVNNRQIQKATYQTITDTSSLTFGNFQGTISSFRVWNASDTLVAEYLPALDSNKQACMYDTVNKEYIYYSKTCTAIMEETGYEDSTFDSMDGCVSDDTSDSENTNTVYDLLKNAMLNANSSSLSVSQYKLTSEELNAIWESMIDDYYVEYISHGSINLYITTENNYAKTCQISGMDSNYTDRLGRVKEAVNNVLDQIDSKMTDLDKVLLAHEYLIDNTEYSSSNEIYYTAAGPLGEGYGVCSGYARAMIALLHCMDIEAYYVTSGKMNHGWIYVKLDGNYYHIDPTWDDTRKGTNDMYQHRFLLRNDSELGTISTTDIHYGWTSYQIGDVTSNSTRFTNWYVHDVAGTMFYYDGLWYFWDINTNSIKRANIGGTSVTTIVNGSSISAKLKIKSIENGVLYYYKGSTLCKQSI